MEFKGFKGLKVWEKAHAFALRIYQETRKFPEEEKYGLISQFRRSAVSVPANIAEGYRKTPKEFGRYLDIAQASLEESKYYIILSKDLNYIAEPTAHDLLTGSAEIGRMTNGLKKSL